MVHTLEVGFERHHIYMKTMEYLLINGYVENEKEEEGDESMDDKIEVDTVDLDIGLVSPQTCGYNILILVCGVGCIVCVGAVGWYHKLDHLVLVELGYVVAEGEDGDGYDVEE